MAIEKPNYVVVQTIGEDLEVREYGEQLLAEVTVTGNRDQAASAAFSVLAGFIFGENVENQKISMTAPVVQVPQLKGVEVDPLSADTWVVNFMMPSKFTRETLPVPEDNRITIRTSEPYKVVAYRFSGKSTPRNMEKHMTAANAAVKASGLTVEGEPILAFYDAPFVPGFMRRNEVMYRLTDAPS